MGCTVGKVTMVTASQSESSQYSQTNKSAKPANQVEMPWQNGSPQSCNPTAEHRQRASKQKKMKIKMKHGSFYVDHRICMKYQIEGKMASSEDSVVLKVTSRFSREQFVIKVLKKQQRSG